MSNRNPARGARSTPSIRLPHVEETRGAGGQTYLYYRRNGRRIQLPHPEGSGAFLLAYERAKRVVEEGATAERTTTHTLDAAVTSYLSSADYRGLKQGSREDYRRTLDHFRGAFGNVAIAAMDGAWIDALRDKYAPVPDEGLRGDPIGWNALRSRMIVVTRHFMKRHEGVLAANHWEQAGRLKVPESDAHRPWPPEVLRDVMRAATPEFRALLVGYLLTAQRGGDVTRFGPGQYDETARTLRLTQEKTASQIVLHVPGALAKAFDRMKGRHKTRLFVTPRGRAWTTGNAQETLQRLLKHLGLERYTLHGLRATGPVALKVLGFENRAIMAVTGHKSSAALEIYLRGVVHYPLAREAQEALGEEFRAILDAGEIDANDRKFAGTTGRAAAKKKARCQQAANSQPDTEGEGKDPV